MNRTFSVTTTRKWLKVVHLLKNAMFPERLCEFTVGMVLNTHINCICDMVIEIVFVWDVFGASTLHYEAVEQHPNTSKG